MTDRWERISSEARDENPWWTYRVDRFRTADGREGAYYYHEATPAVSVIGRLDDSRCVMVREYRYLLGGDTVAVMAGTPEQGEALEDAARREFLEETGYEAGELEIAGVLATAPAFSDERIHVYLATGLQKRSDGGGDAFESIDVLVMTAEEIDAAIASGEMWDSNAIAAWALVRHRFLA